MKLRTEIKAYQANSSILFCTIVTSKIQNTLLIHPLNMRPTFTFQTLHPVLIKWFQTDNALCILLGCLASSTEVKLFSSLVKFIFLFFIRSAWLFGVLFLSLRLSFFCFLFLLIRVFTTSYKASISSPVSSIINSDKSGSSEDERFRCKFYCCR